MNLRNNDLNIAKLLIEELELDCLALTGCRSDGIDTEFCEYNFINNKKNDTIELKNKIIQLCKIENNITNIAEYYKFLNVEIIADKNFQLKPLVNKAESIKNDIYKDLSISKKIEINSKIDKITKAIEKNYVIDYSFFGISLGYTILEYEFAKNQIKFHPTHIIEQLKQLNSKREVIEQSLDLLLVSRATDSNIKRRLEGIKALILETVDLNIINKSEISFKLEIMKNKTEYLINNHKLVDAYSMLGYEFIKLIERINTEHNYRKETVPHYNKIISEIFETENNNIKITNTTFKKIDFSTKEIELKKLINNLKEL